MKEIVWPNNEFESFERKDSAKHKHPAPSRRRQKKPPHDDNNYTALKQIMYTATRNRCAHKVVRRRRSNISAAHMRCK